MGEDVKAAYARAKGHRLQTRDGSAVREDSRQSAFLARALIAINCQLSAVPSCFVRLATVNAARPTMPTIVTPSTNTATTVSVTMLEFMVRRCRSIVVAKSRGHHDHHRKDSAG